MNTAFLIYAYLISLSVDWILQWDWQANNKSKWSIINEIPNYYLSFSALLSHSFIYAIATCFILYMVGVISLIQTDLIFIVLFITHFFIDSRIPVKMIMKFKGMTDEQINDYQNYGFMHIGIDHRLHEMVLIILSFYIK